MSDAPAAAKQKKWYDPTYCGGMSPEEIDAFLGSPDRDWLCRLGVLKEDGWPFVTPMWYQWRGGSFYVVGRKRSAWVQDLIREPALLRLHRRGGDAAGGRAAEGARPLHGHGRRRAGRGRGVAVGAGRRRDGRRYAGRAARGAEAVVRLGAVPRPARPGRGRHDDLAGRRLGKALPRPEAARRARGADGRHGGRRREPTSRRSTSSASATAGSTCRPSATRSSTSAWRRRCCRARCARSSPSRGSSARRSRSRAATSPARRLGRGDRADAAVPRDVRAADARLGARLDDARRRGGHFGELTANAARAQRLRRLHPRRQPARHRGPARDRLPGLLPRPLAAERHRALGDDRVAGAGHDRRRHGEPGRHRLRRVRRDPRRAARRRGRGARARRGDRGRRGPRARRGAGRRARRGRASSGMATSRAEFSRRGGRAARGRGPALRDPRGLRRREPDAGRDPARDRRAELPHARAHHRGGARGGRGRAHRLHAERRLREPPRGARREDRSGSTATRSSPTRSS